jgi:hypothetical protein
MGNAQVHGTEIKTMYRGSAPITEEALSFIKEHTAGSTVLEIGCGSGIYAKLLRDRGVKVIATDAGRINKEGLLPPNNNKRMAKFTNRRAISNMIEENAVSAVEKYGQKTDLSLFLSFPLPVMYSDDSPQYDELALRDFKGNKFFLIALYDESLFGKKNYDPTDAHDSTGSRGFHDYLAKAWNVKDKLLLETGRMSDHSFCYLLYFKRKTANNNSNSSNSSNSSNRHNKNARNLTPFANATKCNLNNLDTGRDGKMWIVKKRSNGVKYWKRFTQNNKFENNNNLSPAPNSLKPKNTNSSNRRNESDINPTPITNASKYNINHIETGRDGKLWIVKKNSNGKFWGIIFENKKLSPAPNSLKPKNTNK